MSLPYSQKHIKNLFQLTRGWIQSVNVKRWARYKYLQLFRAKGGASMVAKGFSIGLAIEMFTLPTAGLAFFLIFPLVYFFEASLAGALVGFVFGKVIYLPLAFLNNIVGGFIVPDHVEQYLVFLPDWLEKVLYVNIKLIVGGIVDGAILGMLAYFPIKALIEMYTANRNKKRSRRTS